MNEQITILGARVVVEYGTADDRVELVDIVRTEALPKDAAELMGLALGARRDDLDVHVSPKGMRRLRDIADAYMALIPGTPLDGVGRKR